VEAGICPADRNDRNIDVGKDVGGSAQDDHRRGDEDQQRKNDKCVRSIESKFDDPHKSFYAPRYRDRGLADLHEHCGTIG
jgi:hypothetical protein